MFPPGKGNGSHYALSRRPAAKRTAAADTFRGQIIALLADGKARDAQAILDEGRKQGLFTATTTKQSVYENLLLYIQQEAAKGRKPAVVEDPISRKFRQPSRRRLARPSRRRSAR